ncbi:MAG: hypothetical protein WBM36_10105, partial [Lysobacterales bacterium]
MKKRLVLPLLSIFLLLFAVFANAHHEPATNKDGSVVTGVLTASFNPFPSPGVEATVPFPSNLLFFSAQLD